MFEIFFLAYYLPKRMRILAKERDRSALGWSLAAIGAWLGAEFLIIFIWIVIYGLGLIFWGWRGDVDRQPVTYVVYFIALIAGMVAADVVRRRLMAKPVTREVKQWKGMLG